VSSRLAGKKSLRLLGLAVLLACELPAAAQAPDPPAEKVAQTGLAEIKGTEAAARDQVRGQKSLGAISGTVVDRTGAVVAGALVKLSRDSQSSNEERVSDGEGQFSFVDVAPGPFELTTAAEGFATAKYLGILQSGETRLVPPIELALASAAAEVHVTMTRTEMAEAEIKDEEKQRVLGIIPNYYVTYNPAAVPLNTKQKFELALRTTVDPVSIGLTGAVAGIEQATNTYSGYGQGAQGYAKRFGASYANLVTSTYIGSAILPSLLKQDPRYFYKGTGTVRSRVLYAIANAVICKGDNGRWQPNYSGLIGNAAAGAISNLYYPATDRQDAAMTAENLLIGIGTNAAANILQEFVVRRFTPRAPKYAPAEPEKDTK
jgi:hypothetical protein